MATIRNKDGELWDPESGFVYNDDGTVRRPGLPGLAPLTKAQALKEGGV